MGFRPEATLYTLKFETPGLKGLEVKVGSCTVAEFNDMLRYQASTGVEVAENNEKTIEMFLSKLVDWNLEHRVDGEWQPTPQTLDGVRLHEQPIIRDILRAWQTAMTGVPEELGKGSTDGRESQERSLGLG